MRAIASYESSVYPQIPHTGSFIAINFCRLECRCDCLYTGRERIRYCFQGMRGNPTSGRDSANASKLQTHHFLLYSIHPGEPVFSTRSNLEISSGCASTIRSRRSRTGLLSGRALPRSGSFAKSYCGRIRRPDREFCSFCDGASACKDWKRPITQ